MAKTVKTNEKCYFSVVGMATVSCLQLFTTVFVLLHAYIVHMLAVVTFVVLR